MTKEYESLEIEEQLPPQTEKISFWQKNQPSKETLKDFGHCLVVGIVFVGGLTLAYLGLIYMSALLFKEEMAAYNECVEQHNGSNANCTQSFIPSFGY